MNTKPRAKKFRIRRTAPLTSGPVPAKAVEARPIGSAAAARSAVRASMSAATAAQRAPDYDVETAFEPDTDGFGDDPFPTATNANISEPQQVSAEAEMDAIRREGLTGRQLRMARRVAAKHNLAPTSDFDAVRLLRQKGIDPFERSTMLQLVVADGQQTAPEGDEVKLPTTVKPPQLPSTKVLGGEERAREIYRIQQDIARRRRRRMALLLARLSFFVLLPTIIAGYYFYAVATPLYATKSEFLIQKADAAAAGSLSGLFSGTQFATSQDSLTVQSYLQSRDAMLRLDREEGFKAHYQQEWIDPIKRLPPDASNEETYKLYSRDVKVSYDPTEGIVKLQVIAADPATSQQFSLALLHYAEEQVDHLSSRLREDQMKGAQETYEDAEAKMLAAQQKVLELQEKLGVLDPISESTAVMTQVTGFEVQLREKQLELQALLANTRPNKARVDGVKADISRLQALIAELRSQMTDSVGDNASLARITAQLRLAETDLETRQVMVQQALAQLETARIEANKQVRYLAIGVSPVAPDQPTFPRKFENTLLTMLIFAGIYLMISLTASILKEQVSA